MRTTNQARFLSLTHVDPDYFIRLICEFLSPLEDLESLGSSGVLLIRFIDDDGEPSAMVRFTEDSIVITKEPAE